MFYLLNENDSESRKFLTICPCDSYDDKNPHIEKLAQHVILNFKMKIYIFLNYAI